MLESDKTLAKINNFSTYLFIYLFTNFAKDNLAGEISQNYCSNNETPKHQKKKKKKKREKEKNNNNNNNKTK